MKNRIKIKKLKQELEIIKKAGDYRVCRSYNFVSRGQVEKIANRIVLEPDFVVTERTLEIIQTELITQIIPLIKEYCIFNTQKDEWGTDFTVKLELIKKEV